MTGEDRGELTGEALVKETSRLIRLARSHWDAHENAACRAERDRALVLYARLSSEEKRKIPQVLLVWLRYRSEKYFGAQRTAPGTAGKPRGKKRSGTSTPESPTPPPRS
ncbi:MAG: hypothetical protein ACOYM2_10185 [Rectinemataceae bacterium]